MRSSIIHQEELFYLISPSPSIGEFVSMLKTHIEDILGHQFESRFSKAHVSLKKDNHAHNESLLYDAEEKLCRIKPFIVPVKNLKVFWQGNNSRTIYLDITYKTPICEIFEILTGNYNADFVPHITIAKNLEINDFLKVWRNLKNISYSNDFQCDHITVLKKSGRSWGHHIDLPLVTSQFPVVSRKLKAVLNS